MSKKKKNKKSIESNFSTQVQQGGDGEMLSTYSYQPCHVPTEVYPNIILGKASQVNKFINMGVEMLIPLDSVDGYIWKNWRGEILYIPIVDGGVLPDDLEARFVEQVLSIIKTRKVAIFCIGGHGRTGYFASLILGKLGIENPIKFIRGKYCKEVVETSAQVDNIAHFLNNPNLKKEAPSKGFPFRGYYDYWNDCTYESQKKITNRECEYCDWYIPSQRTNKHGKCSHQSYQVSSGYEPIYPTVMGDESCSRWTGVTVTTTENNQDQEEISMIFEEYCKNCIYSGYENGEPHCLIYSKSLSECVKGKIVTFKGCKYFYDAEECK